MKVYFCHGLESGPHGSKYKALVAAGLPTVAPDFRGMNLMTRISHLYDLLKKETEDVILVGSSFGGATAYITAAHAPDRIKGLILCAPATEHEEVHTTLPTIHLDPVIIHGIEDTVVPLTTGLRLLEHAGRGKLIVINDGHRLGSDEALKTIVEETTKAFRA